MGKEEITIRITKDEAYAVAEFIDAALLDYIRQDVDTDSLYWLKNVLRVYELLGNASEYEGMPEEMKGAAWDNGED